MSSDTPLRDALAKLDTLPMKEAELGVVASDQDGVGVTGRVSTPLGKGWSLSASGQWVHRTGWQAAGKVTWKGK